MRVSIMPIKLVVGRLGIFELGSAWRRCSAYLRFGSGENRGDVLGSCIMKKILAVVALASVSVPAFAVSVIDYASLSTAVTSELSAGIAAALAGVGLIWGAKIGLRFVRSMFH